MRLYRLLQRYRSARRWRTIVRRNPNLSYRDLRDLLMEYDADGMTASKLAADRLLT